ncbi:glucoamylase family protein [Rhodonellum sp.]|uniref:glucoamylase family protein n=1 Tax=Rhodonellum sp. TaxID=2231180 RepID=UPI0027222F6B|nr:glucoamylase family protein [Rhodonellum sp.]MDO9554327.1 glucoamylase family protein [Rhodonellum sp.]
MISSPIHKKSTRRYSSFFLLSGILLFALLAQSCQEGESKNEYTLLAEGYDQHVELQWSKLEGVDVYEVMASSDGKNYELRAEVSDTIYLDFAEDLKRHGRIHYSILAQKENKTIEIGKTEVQTRKMSDEELMDMIQQYTFRYFWHGAEPNSGMAPERIHIDGEYENNDAHIVTTGGTGFGIFGLITGIERGWISEEQGLERFEKIVGFLEKADRFHGIWPHWLDGKTGKTKAFSEKDDGADLVESAFLIQGLLALREYYSDGSAPQKAVADRIQKLWETMEWDWFTQGGKNVLYWHWSPKHEWAMNFPLEGYNECLITYVLAAASPTHPIGPEAYHEGWARNGKINNAVQAYGFDLQLLHNGSEKMGGPLFWAHYSYLGLNPKGLKDRYADYWEENRNQTLINRAWAIENSGGFKGYGEDLWGLTASYSINFYNAHHPGNDNGVISPTAAISSIPYTPEESMRVLKNLYYNYGEKVLGRYGFYDAMSPEHGFYPQRYLAIDQGPMVAMIENHRTGLGWNLFMQASDIQNGLKILGFEQGN